MPGYKKHLFVLAITLAFIGMAAGAAWAAQSYNVAPGSNTMINEHGVCNRVNPPAGPNVFVPTNTSGEWSAFRSAAAGLGIALSSCGCSAGSVGTCDSGVLSEGATGGTCALGYSGTCANLCSGGSLSASSNSCSINVYTMTVNMNAACGSVTGGNGNFNYGNYSYPSVSLAPGATLTSWTLAPFGVINCSNTVYDCYAGAAAGGYAGQTTVSVWMDSNKTITANCTAPWQNSQTFSYTGGDQTFVVPGGVTAVRVKVWGAAGGAGFISTGGNGGYAQADVAVTPGQSLTVIVGRGGGYTEAAGNYYGGGAASGIAGSGGGGGRSEVTGAGFRVIAGGGGGGGDNNGSGGSSDGGQGGGANQNGGNGGDTTAGAGGCNPVNYGGNGGHQTGGGNPAAEGAWCSTAWSAGGNPDNGGYTTASVGQAQGLGGGGYFGGGSGSGRGAGGGAGSGYAGGTGVSSVVGYNHCNTGDSDYGASACAANGNHGRVVIRY